MKQSLFRQFLRYISLNCIAMLGVSLYILGDTFFISYFVGKTALASLSIVLPMFFIFITGPALLLGVGAAAHFSISIGKREFRKANSYAHTAIIAGIIYAILLTLIYWLNPDMVCRMLGANEETYADVRAYLNFLMSFTLSFVMNQIFLVLFRNDDSPQLAMAATLIANFINLFFDWLFMGPCHMGMAGAALATGFSPVAAVAVLAFHLLKTDRYFSFRPFMPDRRTLPDIISTGIPAFITEGANGITTLAFNRTILMLAGTIGVAAYSIVANTAFFVIYILIGIAQGVQPLISVHFGKRDYLSLHNLWRWGIVTMLITSISIVLLGYLFAPQIVSVFNSGGDQELAQMAITGLKLYYISFVAMSINILATNAFAAIADSRSSTMISFTRAIALPIPLLLLVAPFFGMTGVWLAIPLVEMVTLLVTIYCYRHSYQTLQ